MLNRIKVRKNTCTPNKPSRHSLSLTITSIQFWYSVNIEAISGSPENNWWQLPQLKNI